MKIGVYGLYHQGKIVAEALRQAGYEPIAIRDSVPPDGLQRHSLMTAAQQYDDVEATFADLDLLWVTTDTPLNEDDSPRSEVVIQAIEARLPWLNQGCIVLISSQLPVGSTRQLADKWPNLRFAYSPENIRKGREMESFMGQRRIVVGSNRDIPEIRDILNHFCQITLWTTFETAEMVKHALNAFLAMCIVFGNEVGDICQRVGADANDVECALLMEGRISPATPMKYGAAFTGGSLARELHNMIGLAKDDLLFSAVLQSNRRRLA